VDDSGFEAVLDADPKGIESAASVARTAPSSDGHDLFGHPRELVVLASTEFWDRISFHGMLALLVLYMVEQLLLPGHIEHVVGFARLRRSIEAITGPLSTQALATQIFGLYIGLIYFTPVFGGMVGDRLLGRRRTVTLGALLMSAGHFCMAFDRSFLLALLLLILGAGCLRGNLSSQVGDLYAKGDRRRADGFQIYVAMVNTGAFVAPLITGALAQGFSWHYGFGFAGFGMLAGLIIYMSGHRWVPPDPPRSARTARTRLGAHERRTVLILCLMLPLLALFWIAQSQVWNTYNLWARDHLDLMVGGWKLPVPWLQAVDGLAAVVLVPPVVLLWRWQARRGAEPDDVVKLGIGCLIFGASMTWLAAGDLVSGAVGKVPLAWALAFHVIENTGYLFVAPIAIALFSRAAPVAINAMMVSVYYLSIFAGSTISGRLGGLYELLSPARFWLLHALIVGTGGLLILLFARRLRRELTP
jgi:POT family proton-dependent oligopeptide transporter